MAKRSISSSGQLTATYVVAATIWVIGSDVAMAAWSGGDYEMAWRQVAKGVLFVAVSGAVLWVCLRRLMLRTREVSDALLLERRAAAALAERKERLQATIARANQAALKYDEPAQLCREICDALVDTAGMRFACIGWENPLNRRIEMAHRAGRMSAAVDQFVVTTAEGETSSSGPTGRAVRLGITQVCHDIAADPSLVAWRALAKEHGVNSCAAVPIADGEGRRGALSVYDDKVGTFDREIVAMLEQLGADLRNGLEVMSVRLEVRRQTEALRRSEERWQFALEGSGDGVWDWTLETGEWFCSRRLLDMLGCAPGELCTRDDWDRLIHPEDRPRVIATLQRYLDGETAEFVCEHRMRHRRGDYLWLLGRGKTLADPVSGRPVRMIGTNSDITARKAADRQLHLLQAALQAAPVGVMITDREGTIEWVNRAFTTATGYTLEEVVGRNPRLQKSGRHDAATYASLWQTITRGDTWQGELINRRKDGTEYPETMTIAAVRDESGAVAHFVAVKQDISERRQLEQNYLRAQRLEGVGQLASGIAHDLNNVLAPILLSVEMLNLKNTEPGMRASLKVIESAARRGAGIVRQVLTFARGVDGERAPLRPKDLLREVAVILEETFPRQIRLERVAPDELPLIEGDATQMHQMLLNLAINARDVMEGGGTLRLEALSTRVKMPLQTVAGVMPPGDYVEFRVRDTGPGIAPELMVRIFEPFFTTKPKGKGTGLGLATTLGIVRSHRGFITVDSSSRGTQFAIFLPAAPGTTAGTDAAPPLPSLRGEGRLLLVCDDEPSIRDLTVTIFESRGFRVVVASDGHDSLAMYSKHRAELAAVVLDLMMPGCNGTEVLAAIRRESTQLPVLLSSGLVSEAISADALAKETAAGPTGMIQKPYTAPALLDALDQLLRRAAQAEA